MSLYRNRFGVAWALKLLPDGYCNGSTGEEIEFHAPSVWFLQGRKPCGKI